FSSRRRHTRFSRDWSSDVCSSDLIMINNKWSVSCMAISHSELLQLKNLGMASVNILHAIGINTYADLRRVGAVEAYRRIKARHINVSKVMLYALQGALMDVHWNDL